MKSLHASAPAEKKWGQVSGERLQIMTKYKFLNREMNGISRNERACKVHEVSLILYCSPNMCFGAWHIVGA